MLSLLSTSIILLLSYLGKLFKMSAYSKKRKEEKFLEKSGKKSLDRSKDTHDTITSCLATFNRMYVVTHDNPDVYFSINNKAKWSNSRLVLGSFKHISKSLEMLSTETELNADFKKLIVCLRLPTWLLFTNLPKEEVLQMLSEEYVENFAKPGKEAPIDYILTKGPHKEISKTKFKKMWGVPITMVEGVATLLEDFELCKAGSTLNFRQCKLLRLLRIKFVGKAFRAVACWSKDVGFECFDSSIDIDTLLSNKAQQNVGEVKESNNESQMEDINTIHDECSLNEEQFVEDA